MEEPKSNGRATVHFICVKFIILFIESRMIFLHSKFDTIHATKLIIDKMKIVFGAPTSIPYI